MYHCLFLGNKAIYTAKSNRLYLPKKKWGKITATEVTQAMGNNYQLEASSKLPNRKVVKNSHSIWVEITT